jgi:hypothetical protein
MSDASFATQRSPVELGALITLVALAFAAVVGLIAVIDADNAAAGFGTGLGIAVFIFLAGATIAAALACLTRERVEIVALSSIVAAGLATDLLVLAVWLDIDNEAYAKVAGVAFVWSFFALVVLGLTLAAGRTERLARSLYVGAVGTAALAGLISTWLVVTAGGKEEIASGAVPENGTVVGLPYGALGDDDLLQALGAALVVLAALWFATLAAGRLLAARGDVTR